MAGSYRIDQASLKGALLAATCPRWGIMEPPSFSDKMDDDGLANAHKYITRRT